MAVKGANRLKAILRRFPEKVKANLIPAVQQAAQGVLADMQMLTPFDPENPGRHARDGLTISYEKEGLVAHVGLTTPELTSEYFWFRFLDGGTKGGEVTYWRRTKDGKRRQSTMRVPARMAHHIRARALDGNLDDIDRVVRQAIMKAANG